MDKQPSEFYEDPDKWSVTGTFQADKNDLDKQPSELYEDPDKWSVTGTSQENYEMVLCTAYESMTASTTVMISNESGSESTDSTIY